MFLMLFCQTTNNIYFLCLTIEVIQEDFILLKSDLIFDVIIMMYPNRITLSNILS